MATEETGVDVCRIAATLTNRSQLWKYSLGCFFNGQKRYFTMGPMDTFGVPKTSLGKYAGERFNENFAHLPADRGKRSKPAPG